MVRTDSRRLPAFLDELRQGCNEQARVSPLGPVGFHLRRRPLSPLLFLLRKKAISFSIRNTLDGYSTDLQLRLQQLTHLG
jgi:hypothetical protein